MNGVSRSFSKGQLNALKKKKKKSAPAIKYILFVFLSFRRPTPRSIVAVRKNCGAPALAMAKIDTASR